MCDLLRQGSGLYQAQHLRRPGLQHVALTEEQKQEAERQRHDAEAAEQRAAEEQVQRMAQDRRDREEAAQRAHNMALHRAQQACAL